MKKKYNAMLDVAFSVISEHENLEDIPVELILSSLRQRLAYLEEHPKECAEAFGFNDQYEIADDDNGFLCPKCAERINHVQVYSQCVQTATINASGQLDDYEDIEALADTQAIECPHCQYDLRKIVME